MLALALRVRAHRMDDRRHAEHARFEFGPAELNDETLRDGVQSPSVKHPPLDVKKRALHLMDRLGVAAASLGLPAAGGVQAADVEVLLREVADHRLALAPHCAARTKVEDLRPVADIIQRVGVSLAVYSFIGSSPIRRFAEGWSLDDLLRTTEEALVFARREGLEIAFVTEDTTRSCPRELSWLFRHVIGLGARRLVLCDTVGHATPEGARRLVQFTRALVEATGEPVAIDWHGHDDRGLAVANSRAAELAGVDRIHGTVLGIGERCGNAALDQLILNQAIDFGRPLDQRALRAYRSLVRDAFGHPAHFPWAVSAGEPQAMAAAAFG